jgi:hypothetical protein
MEYFRRHKLGDLLFSHAEDIAADVEGVLAEQGGGVEGAGVHAGDAERLAVDGVIAQLWVVDASEEAAVLQLRVFEEVLRPLDDARGDARRLQSLGQGEWFLLDRPLREQAVEFLLMRFAVGERGEAWV